MKFSLPLAGLFHMVLSPILAAVHFLVCYASTGILCERSPDAANLPEMRLALGVFTLVLLCVISVLTWRAWQRLRRQGKSDPITGTGSGAFYAAFLLQMTFLLGILSGVGVLFVASPLVFVESCA